MKRILIDVHPSSTKVCIVKDSLLEEFWVERKNINKLVGNIYKGKVMNVLPGMQAAFVNIGLERNAFLYAGDIVIDGEKLEGAEQLRINLKAGDSVLCQVEKDQFGTKGARITTNITLPGRVLVYMPQIDYVGVSHKITDEKTKERLVKIASEIKPEGCGVILRTQAQFCDEDELRAEMKELVALWEKIKADTLKKPAGTLVYKEQDLAIRAVRDMLADVDEVVINDEKLYNEFKRSFPYVEKMRPEIFKFYNGAKDLLQFYDLAEQIDALLKRKVVLKNGAYLIIDRTEALTVIDVNTGKFVGNKNLEETVFETNKIAAVEIARQLRLRNIGGIVVIDLGLVELTRKKTRSMIETVMLQPCPYCGGDGYVYGDEHMIMKIRSAITQVFEGVSAKAVVVTVAPSLFNKMFSLRYLEKECQTVWKDKRIYVIPDASMHIEKYKIQSLNSAILDLPDNARMLY